jgi:putative nucleotidyltransferase with HDIG domain
MEPELQIKINEDILEDTKAWFSNYVETFKHNAGDLLQNTILKEEHTKRVRQEILMLAEHLELNDDEKCLAEVIALLHDVGRFEQYARYHTFVDKRSKNHAELGIKILRKYGVLNQLDELTRNLIYRTIRYHNRAALPQEETETCLFFTKLLRDADKLDIWKVVTDYYCREDGSRNDALELDLPDTPGISNDVYQDLINKRIVHVQNLRSLNDFKLLQAGWIFDINFESTRQSVLERKYLEKIQTVLPETDEVREIFATIYDYIDSKNSEFNPRGKGLWRQ